jgi:hypothetical protein
MMDELPIPETTENEVPRWVQVLMGLVLALLTLLCGFASLTKLVIPNEKSPILTIVSDWSCCPVVSGCSKSAFVC